MALQRFFRLVLFIVLFAIWATNAMAQTAVYRINAGGSAYTDPSGKTWQADAYYNTGYTYSTTQAIAGTTSPGIYQTERYDVPTAPDLTYALPVTNGTYRVNLHFAEIYFQAAGARVFNVYIEGALAYNNLDIYQQAGAYTALVLSKDVTVSDGTLNISLQALVENPKISAIEILTTSTPTNQPPVAKASATPTSGVAPLAVQFSSSGSSDPEGGALTYAWTFGDGQSSTSANPSHTYQNSGSYTATLKVTDNGGLTATSTVAITVSSSTPSTALYRINAGGPAYTDGSGNSWSADQYFDSGITYTNAVPIAGTSDDTLFQSERYGTTPNLSYSLPVANGSYTVTLGFAEIYSGAQSVGARVFNVSMEGVVVEQNLDVFKTVGGYTALTRTYDVSVSDGVLNISFTPIAENPKVSFIQVVPGASDGVTLHPVIVVPATTVDVDANGSEAVFLKGSDSHTHEPGRKLVAWEWSEGGTVFATTADTTKTFSVGSHTVQLKITDDATPPKSASTTATFSVVVNNSVPGVLALYYETTSPESLLDSVPTTANYGQVIPTFNVAAENNTLAGTPYTGQVMVRMNATVQIATSGQYTFQATGGTARRLFVNGASATGPITLAAGSYPVEARFAVTSLADIPLAVTYASGSGAQTQIPSSAISHDETKLAPVINTMPSSGSSAGGEQVKITGLGFFPASQVVVNWGSQQLTGSSLSVTQNTISLTSPPGSGTVNITVQTPNGTSDTEKYTYTSNSAVGFTKSDLATLNEPTQAEWGPDGRLYVGSTDGTITAYTFDDNYAIKAVQTISTLKTLSNHAILGLAFNPYDAAGQVRIFVAHGQIYANGGGCFTGPAPYTGQVSVLTGPSFSTVSPLITNLPVSNHDHAVNGMQFDNNGDLLIANGGNTNAGVKDCALGDLPESPLSAGILRARLSGQFSGQINYVETATGNVNNDQVFGDRVDVKAGITVEPFAFGLRNPWDLVVATNGFIYGTFNGPNAGFGAASTSATTQTTSPDDPDGFVLIEKWNYYGHPNRNRGRYDDRQNVWRGSTGSNIPGVFTQRLATVDPSTNGITEYRSNTFGGVLRGHFFAQKWNSVTYDIAVSSDGKSVTSKGVLPTSLNTLDVTAGPGGALLGTDYSNNKLVIQKANDNSAVALFDIFPWRAPKSGGQSFVIGGKGFSGGSTVKIGGVQATITSVSPTRIGGTIPANSNAPNQLVDVVVTTNGQTLTLTKAFRYLGGIGSQPVSDRWIVAANMPISLGEVAGGFINGKMYVVGEGNSSTLAYSAASGTFNTGLAQRPSVGHHHAAEVYNKKLYLIGGLNGAEGKVQIYDPATNTWSLGANMPFAAGSSSSAVIQGQIYVAGGIVAGTTTNKVAKYNPATNTWQTLANMPAGRNHAASATDGKLLYVFGGRGPGSGDGNVVANGYDTVQIYDPVTNKWKSSSDANSTIKPLPQARGGMGKAVFFQGEFYVMGGETLTGAGATSTGVYSRVDIYNPTANTWRRGKDMPTARHGIFPLLNGWQIYVAGGGTSSGSSTSNLHQIYVP